MKKHMLIALLVLGACNSNNSKTDSNSSQLPASLVNNPHTASGVDTAAAGMKPTMDFKDTVHSFGIVHENEIVSYDFAFTNNGKTPLVITSAGGSCGCTVPDYPHEAIPPGQTAIMKVSFNSSGKSGHQEKSVTIHANTLRNVHMLYISADIKKD